MINFILIHIGTNLRDHINDCIQQIRVTNPSAPIWVLVNHSEAYKIQNINGLRIIELESIPLSMKHKAFQERYRSPHSGSLWRLSTERFFYLETFMMMHDLSHMVHMEYDNMIYKDLSEVLHIFQKHYESKIGCTFDADSRGIAGLLYVACVEPMIAFTDFIMSDRALNKTDMDYLALFKDHDRDGTAILALPIVQPKYVERWGLQNDLGHTVRDPRFYSNAFTDFNCIFDAAAIGQYMGGIDPIHNKPNSVGFINETCVFQCDKLQFEWVVRDDGRRFPWVICGTDRVPIVNLHIHCKNLATFKS